jgi:hypothetical protein
MQDRNALVSGRTAFVLVLSQRSAAFPRTSFLFQLSALLVMSVALSLAAVSQQCVAPPNSTMVAWFPFDETSGSTTANLATQNTGTLGGTATFAAGLVGGAMHFDGIGAYMDSPSSIATNFGPGLLTGAPCSGLEIDVRRKFHD